MRWWEWVEFIWIWFVNTEKKEHDNYQRHKKQCATLLTMRQWLANIEMDYFDVVTIITIIIYLMRKFVWWHFGTLVTKMLCKHKQVYKQRNKYLLYPRAHIYCMAFGKRRTRNMMISITLIRHVFFFVWVEWVVLYIVCAKRIEWNERRDPLFARWLWHGWEVIKLLFFSLSLIL